MLSILGVPAEEKALQLVQPSVQACPLHGLCGAADSTVAEVQ